MFPESKVNNIAVQFRLGILFKQLLKNAANNDDKYATRNDCLRWWYCKFLITDTARGKKII